MTKYCNYCNTELNLNNHHQWMAHRSNCIYNPNKQKKIEKLKEYHKNKIKTFKINCKKCGKEIILNITQTKFNKGNHKIFCSYMCSNSHNVSEETKKKISERVKTSEKFILSNQNKKNENINNKDSRNCKECGKLFTCYKWSKQKYCSLKCSSQNNKSKISEIIKEQYKNGKKIYGGRTSWYSVNTINGVIRVQGTYEVRTCKILDYFVRINKIRNWEYTNDRFQYTSIDNKLRFYLLDFKIYNFDNTFYYLEVKGYKTDNDDLKWNSVRNKNYKLEIWFNSDISFYEKLITGTQANQVEAYV